MEKKIRYKCDYCGELFSSESTCLEHEDKHVRRDKAKRERMLHTFLAGH